VKIVKNSDAQNQEDTQAIKELGLNHIRHAYDKINKENLQSNGQSNGSEKKEKKRNIPEDEKRMQPDGQLDLHHVVRVIKAGLVMYYQKRELPGYIKNLIFPFIDIWEMSAHTIVDKYAEDMQLDLKPEYVCFGGGVLLCIDPVLEHKKGNLKDIFQPTKKADVDKNQQTNDNSPNETEKNYTPEIIDYDLPS